MIEQWQILFLKYLSRFARQFYGHDHARDQDLCLEQNVFPQCKPDFVYDQYLYVSMPFIDYVLAERQCFCFVTYVCTIRTFSLSSASLFFLLVLQFVFFFYAPYLKLTNVSMVRQFVCDWSKLNCSLLPHVNVFNPIKNNHRPNQCRNRQTTAPYQLRVFETQSWYALCNNNKHVKSSSFNWNFDDWFKINDFIGFYLMMNRSWNKDMSFKRFV